MKKKYDYLLIKNLFAGINGLLKSKKYELVV
jgi:hypothetical protein